MPPTRVTPGHRPAFSLLGVRHPSSLGVSPTAPSARYPPLVHALISPSIPHLPSTPDLLPPPCVLTRVSCPPHVGLPLMLPPRPVSAPPGLPHCFIGNRPTVLCQPFPPGGLSCSAPLPLGVSLFFRPLLLGDLVNPAQSTVLVTDAIGA